MSNFLFPVVNNKRQDAAITLEDFKGVSPKAKAEKPDLTFKDGKFTLNKKFIEGRTATTGFVGVVGGDGTGAYLLKSTTDETFAQTASVKGEKAILSFNSSALEFVITNAGVSLEKDLYLQQVESKDGWDVFSISNEKVADVAVGVEEPVEEPVTQIQDPTLPEEEPVLPQEEAVTATVTTEGEVGQLANEGVEEVSYSNEEIENLL